MDKNFKQIIKSLGENRVKLNEPMSAHTYFKIGGPADLFYEAKTATELTHAVQSAINYQIAYFVLGGGSNILVSDKGIRGLVIKNRADGIRPKGFQGKILAKTTQVKQALIEAESGTLLNKLVRYSIEESLKGLEVFLSVPGTVGGAIYNNSHYRPEKNEFISNLVHSATLIDSSGKLQPVNHNYFKFGYDYSILHRTHEVVVSATFSLAGDDKDKLWQIATETVKRRNLRQPIGIACSGCTFRNISQAETLRLGTPDHTQSAGYLIDQAGFKGTQVGQAKVSQVHASFIENLGGATASDVLQLIELIQEKVFAKFGVKLELEIFLVGEF